MLMTYENILNLFRETDWNFHECDRKFQESWAKVEFMNDLPPLCLKYLKKTEVAKVSMSPA